MKTKAKATKARTGRATAARVRAAYSVWWANLCGTVEQLLRDVDEIKGEMRGANADPFRAVVPDAPLHDLYVTLLALSEEVPAAAPIPAAMPRPLAGVPVE